MFNKVTASVAMCQAFGAAASPMSFGEVYTAIQQGVIDGAENNELALTSNKHGEVAKYFSYNKHQMIPDLLIGNLSFLNGLSKERKKRYSIRRLNYQMKKNVNNGMCKLKKLRR
ncbi:MAG: TRAP transporter substrate-binding protein DctP [Holdemanella porci]